jgi:uncharacterized protein (DUF2141 family)
MSPLRRTLAAAFAATLLLALAAPRSRAALPMWIAETGAANPFAGIDAGSFVTGALADLDADGDLDLVAGNQVGALLYYENTGTPDVPAFTQRTGTENPFDAASVNEYAAPAFADLDGDGDLDLVVAEHLGALRYFENTGDALAPVFAEQIGAANPLSGFVAASVPVPAFVDLDADGDFDLAAGGADGAFRYYENTGTALAPVFVERSGIESPLNGLDLGFFSTASFVDADADGDFDLVSGLSSGVFAWFENVGTPASASFVARVGDENPLLGLSAGSFSTPVFADLDGDLLPDLVAGAGNGTFFFFRAPEPASAACGIAAFAAISALARRRARRALG